MGVYQGQIMEDIQQDTVNPRARARFMRRRSKANTYSLPDFQRMIWDLKRLGWSHEKVAYQLDVQASTVSAWATGTRPFYDHGEQFIEFWREQAHLHHVPRMNERYTLQYKVGQIAMDFDAGEPKKIHQPYSRGFPYQSHER